MTNSLPTDFKLDFLGKQITPSSSGKDLGVVIDLHLTYDDHIDSIVSSCMGKLCQISRVKDSFDKDTLCLVVSSLVMSKLFYCSSVWSNTTVAHRGHRFHKEKTLQIKKIPCKHK